MGLIGEQVVGLLHALHKKVVVSAEALDLQNGQVDQHTSDLGAVRAHDLRNEFEDGRADLLLVVRVHLVYGDHPGLVVELLLS